MGLFQFPRDDLATWLSGIRPSGMAARYFLMMRLEISKLRFHQFDQSIMVNITRRRNNDIISRVMTLHKTIQIRPVKAIDAISCA